MDVHRPATLNGPSTSSKSLPVSTTTPSVFTVTRFRSSLGLLLLAAAWAACGDDGPCINEGAKRTNGVCGCPTGTRYVEDGGAKTGRCVALELDAGAIAATADGGPETGLGSRLDGSGSKPDGDVSPGSSDAQVASGPVADASVQGGNVSPDSSDAHVAVSDASAQGGNVLPDNQCKGSAGKPVCTGSTMHLCSDQGVATAQLDCKSEQLCQLGLSGGSCSTCIPGVGRCTGSKLEVCGKDGLAFEMKETCASAALCNALAAACTKSACLAGSKTCAGDVLRACNADQTGFEEEKQCGAGLCDNMGQQCDACIAGAAKCEGDLAQTCNTDGQSYKMTACSGQTPHCVGAGKCVQCAATTDCAAPAKDCQAATCNTAAGTCSIVSKSARAPCAGGLCDGAGDCVACITQTDCKSGELCSNGACIPAARCGDRIVNQASEECDDGNTSDTDACSKNCTKTYCGDQALQTSETCDPTVAPWTAWDCGTNCRPKTLYGPCAQSSDCLGLSETCLLNVCTVRCATFGPGPSDCPAPPSSLKAICGLGGAPYCAASCTSGRDCSPAGSACLNGNPSFCTGCQIDADCPSGRCVLDQPGETNSPTGVCE